MNEIRVSYQNKYGVHCMLPVSDWRGLEKTLRALHRRGIRAVAHWYNRDGQRIDDAIGGVSAHPDNGKLMWWCECAG